MASERSIPRYRNWYARLLRLHSKRYYERFGEGMEQTFNDLCRERRHQKRALFGFVLWIFFETFAGIVRENTRLAVMRNKNIIRIALATAFLLLLPALAMQITDEVAWGPADFAVAGALLFGTGLAYELMARKAGAIAYRAATGIALAAALILIWSNLAVGIIGSEDNPANLMYAGVLAVGIAGAIIARLEPHGMARALFATAIAQALVALIALVAKLGPRGAILTLNGVFVMLFVGSALLFRRASATASK